MEKDIMITRQLLLTALTVTMLTVPVFSQGNSKSTNKSKNALKKTANPVVLIVPRSKSAIYKLGEKIIFDIKITGKNGQPYNGNVDIKLTREDWHKIIQKKNIKIVNGIGSCEIKADKIGFIRCIVTSIKSGTKWKKLLGTAAIEPFKIKHTQTLPNDFKKFWNNEIKAFKKVKVDLVRLEDKTNKNKNVKVEYINFGNINGTRFYGVLSSPVKPGKYEAILYLPGAGVRPYNAAKSTNSITLRVGVHGIPINKPMKYYNELRKGKLHGYSHFGKTDRNKFYYRRVILGCLRALDILINEPNVNPKKITVYGGSQGGALSLILGGLDPRITFVFASVPAMCDHTGKQNGRSAGWPQLFSRTATADLPAVRKVSQYYDTVNFARFITVPVVIGVGLNDVTCQASSVFSAYEVIPTKKKELIIDPRAGHRFGVYGGIKRMQAAKKRLSSQK
jgi:cephalosporin-C deacetylase-like acetyl esterase